MDFYNKYFEKCEVKIETKEKEIPIHWWAIGIIALGILIYFINFAVFPYIACQFSEIPSCEWSWLSNATGAWGEFGDFIGGTINPFIGLLTVILLVQSIKLTTDALKQNEEALQVSKDELIETRRAVEQATVAQEKMEHSLRDQLIVAKSQNNFANLFVHREEFVKYAHSKLRSGIYALEVHSHSLHQTLFKGSFDKIDENETEKFRAHLLEFLEFFHTFPHRTSKDLSEACKFLHDHAKKLQEIYCEDLVIVSINNSNFETISVNGTTIKLPNGQLRDMLLGYVEYLEAHNLIFSFDPTYDFRAIRTTIKVIKQWLTYFQLVHKVDEGTLELEGDFITLFQNYRSQVDTYVRLIRGA